MPEKVAEPVHGRVGWEHPSLLQQLLGYVARYLSFLRTKVQEEAILEELQKKCFVNQQMQQKTRHLMCIDLKTEVNIQNRKPKISIDLYIHP